MQIKLNFMEPKKKTKNGDHFFFLSLSWNALNCASNQLGGAQIGLINRHTHTNTHIYSHIHPHIHTYTHTYAYIYTCIVCEIFNLGPISCFLPLTFIIIYFIYHICICICIYLYINLCMFIITTIFYIQYEYFAFFRFHFWV